jgi:competence protein ComEA
MATGKYVNGWTITAVILVLVIITGGIVIWTRYDDNQPVEITLAPEPELSGEIYIDGAVNNPGFYSLNAGDSINDMLIAAGGATDNADLKQLTLHVPSLDNTMEPQKININLAEAWLLESLPSIGKVRAQAIIDYRQQHGPFRNIMELANVEGIGNAIFEEIKHLITVAD